MTKLSGLFAARFGQAYGRESCSLGVGCDEAGVCYASAHGAPENCPRAGQEDLDRIALVLQQIAYVAGELKAVRDAGFTSEALKWPRTEAGMIAICAFNGIDPIKAPRGWYYYPNEGTKKAWERVIAALEGKKEFNPFVDKITDEQMDEVERAMTGRLKGGEG